MLNKINPDNYNTDKIHIHKFLDFYISVFEKLPNHENLNILEIGIYDGESLRMWRDLFPNSNVYGIDINEHSIFSEERITCFKCSQVDFDRFDILFQNVQFDIIIDDGGHFPRHQLDSLKYMFPKYLKSGGVYIEEDICTSLPHTYQFYRQLDNTNIIDYLHKDIYIDDSMKNTFSEIITYQRPSSIYSMTTAIYKI